MGKEFCYSETPLQKRKPCEGRLVETVERWQLRHLRTQNKRLHVCFLFTRSSPPSSLFSAMKHTYGLGLENEQIKGEKSALCRVSDAAVGVSAAEESPIMHGQSTLQSSFFLLGFRFTLVSSNEMVSMCLLVF